VVLDRAVARAATEGASWLSGDMRKFDVDDPFVGGTTPIRTNPYINTFVGVFNPFYPSDSDRFTAEIERRVRAYASVGIIGGLGGPLTVDIQYNHYLIAGDLVVNAHQRMAHIFDLRIIGIQPSALEHHASATARVFNHGSMLNTVSFIFDGAREISGGRLDISNVRGFLRDAPGNVDTWLEQLTSGEDD